MAEAELTTKLCPSCNMPIGAEDVLCPLCGGGGLPDASATKLCPACNLPNTGNAQKCTLCGAALPLFPTHTDSSQVFNREEPDPFLSLVGWFFPAIGIVLWLFYRGSDPRKSRIVGTATFYGIICCMIVFIIRVLLMMAKIK